MPRRSPKSEYEPYSVAEMDLCAQRVQLEIKRFEMMQQIDLSAMRNGIEMSKVVDEACRVMALRLSARVASKKYAVKTVRFPENWWEAVKLRFFSPRMLKRWPVKYSEVTLEASAYYPDIEIPDRATYVEIILRSQHGKYL